VFREGNPLLWLDRGCAGESRRLRKTLPPPLPALRFCLKQYSHPSREDSASCRLLKASSNCLVSWTTRTEDTPTGKRSPLPCRDSSLTLNLTVAVYCTTALTLRRWMHPRRWRTHVPTICISPGQILLLTRIRTRSTYRGEIWSGIQIQRKSIFSWEDIMGDLYLKQDSHLQTPLPTNWASLKCSSYKSSADSDAGDSRWDDTESNLSLGLSSAAVCSANTSKGAHNTWDNYTEEEQLPPCSVLPVGRCSVEVPSITTFPPRPFSSLGIRETPKCLPRHENSFSPEESVKGILERRKHVQLTMRSGAEKTRLEYYFGGHVNIKNGKRTRGRTSSIPETGFNPYSSFRDPKTVGTLD
jgi:hypothetical protein